MAYTATDYPLNESGPRRSCDATVLADGPARTLDHRTTRTESNFIYFSICYIEFTCTLCTLMHNNAQLIPTTLPQEFLPFNSAAKLSVHKQALAILHRSVSAATQNTAWVKRLKY